MSQLTEELSDLASLRTGLEVPPEMFDFIEKVMMPGAKKHGANNWLQPDGKKSSLKQMCDSMFHHLAETYVGNLADEETGEYPALHLQTRAAMTYTRQCKGLIKMGENE